VSIRTAAASDRATGLALFAQRAWGRAFSALTEADRGGDLTAKDQETLASVAFLLGRDEEAIASLTRAHQAHAGVGDLEASALVACRIGFRLMYREPARASGWLARAARTLEENGNADCIVHGYLSLMAGIRHAEEGKIDQALVDFGKTIECGRRFDARELVAFGRLGEARSFIGRGQISRGNELLDEVMVAVTDGEVPPENVGVVYCVALEACDETFDLGRAREWTDAFRRWCDAEPEIVPNRGECRVRHAEMLQLHGDWDGAMTAVSRTCSALEGDRTTPAAGAAFYRLAELHRLRGDLGEAEAAYANASANGREPQPGLALLRVAQGQTSVALASIRRALDDTQRPGRRAQVLRASVDIALAAGDTTRARKCSEELTTLATTIGAPMLGAAAAYAHGSVALADGQARAALPSLRDAARMWQQLDAPYEVGRARALAARAHHALGDDDTARLELAAARDAFESLGALVDLARVNALAAELEATTDGQDSPLTDREVEVLRLVATGRTNRAVADALGISEKTVARHVSNIFGKLGLSTRAAATAYAHRNALL
jgi:DNA-binding CsgD family transcriptional regulator